MKKSILITFILLSFIDLNAQIDRINHYVTGTKVSLYPNQCGEELPEAEDKLTFCRSGDLGIVDESFGLNSNRIFKMVTNHFNNDLVFMTSGGISIKKEDGTWDNIPSRAIPTWDNSPDDVAVVMNAEVLPNGNLALAGTKFPNGLVLYDMVEKTMSVVNLPSGAVCSINDIVYDSDRDVCWVLCFSSFQNYLYKYDNDELTFEYELDDDQFIYSASGDYLQYDNNRIFKSSNTGLTVVEIDDDSGTFSETKYDQSTNASLPYDKVNDFEIDEDGSVWIAQSDEDSEDGAIVKFDLEQETYESFFFEHPTMPGFNVPFSLIGKDNNNGEIWAKSNSISGLVSMEIVGNEPMWNHMTSEDFDALELTIANQIRFIQTQEEKLFFCTFNDVSSNSHNEIFVLEDNVWSGINDDEVGNISGRSLKDFQGSYPDDNGGVWWLNKEDNDLTYLIDENNFIHSDAYSPLSERAATVNQSQNLVLATEEGFGEFIPTTLSPFEATSAPDQPTVIAPWSNEIWAASGISSSTQYIVRYINGDVVQEFETDELQFYFHLVMTTDKKAVFVQNFTSDQVIIKVFDPITEDFSELIYPEGLGGTKEVIAAEEGKFWIIAEESMLFYNGTEFEFYNNENLTNSFISGANQITSAVLDQDQNLHFIVERGFYSMLATPYDNLEIETSFRIGGPEGLMPFYQFFEEGFSELTLDSDGDLWLAMNGSLIELQRENGVPEFNPNDIVGLEELSIDNLNFNIYPNPNNDRRLTIELPVRNHKAMMRIFDVTGKIVQETALDDSRSVVSLDGLSNGLYTVQVISENQIGVRKLVVE